MAWSIFKQEMQAKMQNADWNDISDFADFFTKKYDECMKRGVDSVTSNTVIKGNTELMRATIIFALQAGNQAKTEIFYGKSISLLGKGAIAYWSGAEMGKVIPIIPAPGTILNLGVVSNNCTNPGVWPESPITVLPSTSLNPYLDSFILMSSIHLQTIGGICNTISQYPPIAPPGPAILTWTGYTLEPYRPSGAALPPTAVAIAAVEDLYDKLDWSQIPLDKDSPDVQAIINPEEYIEQQIADNPDVDPVVLSQVDDDTDEIITQALVDQGLTNSNENDSEGDVNYNDDNKQQLTPEQAAEKVSKGEDVDTGYESLDELLKAAGRWAPRLGKNPRVRYSNLKRGYVKGIHGLCPQGTQSVVVALTGVSGLGTIRGNADTFSFKGGGSNSFAIPIGGTRYYNNKVKIDSSYTRNAGNWQVGDIVVMGYTGGKPYGHIQVWTGWKWVSDFSQNAIQANNVDTNTIALWRLNANGLATLSKTKRARAA
jgi:hypothetical protein